VQTATAAKEVEAAQLQVRKAQTASDTYAGWLSSGLNSYEQDMLSSYRDEKKWREYATQAQAAQAVASGLAGAFSGDKLPIYGQFFSIFGGAAGGAAAEFSGAAEQSAIDAQIDAAQASFERRQQEWTLQKTLADADADQARMQVQLAQGRLGIAQDEAQAAEL